MGAQLVDRDGAAELSRDRRERGVVDPAGGDPLRERRRIEVDVQRVAVRRHPLGDVDADRGDLPRRAFDPDPREALDARCLDADGADRADERLLEVPAVALDVLAVAGEVEDRIADELARGRGTSTCRRGSVSTISTSAPSGMCSSPSSVRRPRVITGGCSSSTTVSGISPCETAAASERCSSHASRYGVSAEVEEVRLSHPGVMPREAVVGKRLPLGDRADVAVRLGLLLEPFVDGGEPERCTPRSRASRRRRDSIRSGSRRSSRCPRPAGRSSRSSRPSVTVIHSLRARPFAVPTPPRSACRTCNGRTSTRVKRSVISKRTPPHQQLPRIATSSPLRPRSPASAGATGGTVRRGRRRRDDGRTSASNS